MIKTLNFIKEEYKQLRDMVNDIYPHAVSFYGKDKEEIIRKKIEETYFYTLEEDETFEQVNRYIPNFSDKKEVILDEISGNFHYDYRSSKGFVLVPRKNDVKGLTVLAHELYYHAILQNGFINGIGYFHDNCIANEGWATHIEKELLKLMSIKAYPAAENYTLSSMVAACIDKYTDREIISNMLFYQKPFIDQVFGVTENNDDWKHVSKYLDSLPRNTTEQHEDQVNEYVDEYVKRIKGISR